MRLTDVSGNATSIDTLKYIWLDRGPNLIIDHLQLYNQSGHLLEDLQNYHLLFNMEKVRTGHADVQQFRNNFSRKQEIGTVVHTLLLAVHF